MNILNLEKFCVKATANAKHQRDAHFIAFEIVAKTKSILEDAKNQAVLENKIDGKNAEIREAQLRNLFAPIYETLAIAEKEERRARLEMDKAMFDVNLAGTLVRLALGE